MRDSSGSDERATDCGHCRIDFAELGDRIRGDKRHRSSERRTGRQQTGQHGRNDDILASKHQMFPIERRTALTPHAIANDTSMAPSSAAMSPSDRSVRDEPPEG